MRADSVPSPELSHHIQEVFMNAAELAMTRIDELDKLIIELTVERALWDDDSENYQLLTEDIARLQLKSDGLTAILHELSPEVIR